MPLPRSGLTITPTADIQDVGDQWFVPTGSMDARVLTVARIPSLYPMYNFGQSRPSWFGPGRCATYYCACRKVQTDRSRRWHVSGVVRGAVTVAMLVRSVA